jgi:hypothetical protein
MKKQRRFRVSVYPPGAEKKHWPLVHKASRDLATAKKHYDDFVSKIGGKIGFVILHQGKLYLGFSSKTLLDSRWFSHCTDYKPETSEAYLMGQGLTLR